MLCRDCSSAAEQLPKAAARLQPQRRRNMVSVYLAKFSEPKPPIFRKFSKKTTGKRSGYRGGAGAEKVTGCGAGCSVTTAALEDVSVQILSF